MEKAVEYFQKLLPLLAFYPLWAKLIFITAFAFLLFSIFIFAVLYPSAEERRARTAEESEVPADIRTSLEQKVAAAVQTFSQLGGSLSELNSAFVSTRLHLLDHTTAKPKVQDYLQEELTLPLKNDVTAIISALAKLNNSLSAIQQSDFASRCWDKAIKIGKPSALDYIKTQLIINGFSERESTILISDISYVQQFISLAARKLQEFKFEPLVTAVLETNSANIETVGKGYDDAGLRSIIFGGNIIFGFTSPSKAKPKSMIIASWGSAILLDIYKSIPDEAIIRNVLAEVYPRHSIYINTLQLGITPDKSVSSDLLWALQELEKRKDLLFLELS